MPENTLSFLENFFSHHPATNQLLYWRQPSQLHGVLIRWFLSSAVTSWPWLVVSPWMGLFWAVARLLFLVRTSRSARARPGSGQVPRTAGAPCAISLKCDFGAWDVWGNAACFTPARSGSPFLYLMVFCSLAMFPGTGRRISPPELYLW